MNKERSENSARQLGLLHGFNAEVRKTAAYGKPL